MSVADSAWLLDVELVASLATHVVIELVFAGLAITVVRAYRPRGGVLLFAAILGGMLLTSAVTIAYPLAYKLVDNVIGVEQYIWVQTGLGLVNTFIDAVVRIAQIGAVIAVAADPGPIADHDDPPAL